MAPQLSDDKRRRIIQAAGERFNYYGFKKTTMQEIAADVGVAVGTLYLYFKNKDELMEACVDGFAGLHRAQTAEILASDRSIPDKLRAYLTARFEAARATRTGSRHAEEMVREVLRVRPARLVEEGGMMVEAIHTLLQAGVAEGRFAIADPAVDARVFLYSIAWFFPNALTHITHEPTLDDLLLVTNWFLEKWSAR